MRRTCTALSAAILATAGCYTPSTPPPSRNDTTPPYVAPPSSLPPRVETTPAPNPPKLGEIAARQGNEIVVAGRFVHVDSPVVLWMDPGGYDAYRVERRFSPLNESDWDSSRSKIPELTTPNRFDLRSSVLTDTQAERVRGGGWELPLLQSVVDQVVFHFDSSGTSRECFKSLHDKRGLSIHFMVDLDGTIYQTLDVKEKAWHATTSNGRSIGIEIANVGAYEPGSANRLSEWYGVDANGRTRITIPTRLGETGIRTPGFIGRPARTERVRGIIHERQLVQYDFTPEQYGALIKLTAALCKVFPKIKCDYPRNASGTLVLQKLPDNQLQNYQGLIGHYHIQDNKIDPGPAFQWDYLVSKARELLQRQ